MAKQLQIEYDKPCPAPASLSVHSPEMLLAMKNVSREQVKSVTIELAKTTAILTKKDIGAWRQAWQMALNVENPRRSRLYDIYQDAEVDLHLAGCTGQRTDMVLKKAFRLVDKSKKENREATELLEAAWFKDFMRLSLQSRYWGHSLIQFGDVIGGKRFDGVTLVPRRHVIPEYGVIIKNIDDDIKQGYSYREGALSQWAIEAGGADDLGLYLKCAKECISKKNMLAFWDGFGEMFGMPVRIGETNSRDPKETAKIENMLASMGAAAWGLFPEGTTVKFVESSKGDAFNVYDRRIDRANSEMAKAILGQTMTIDNGASLSQSQVHYKIFQNIIDSDADFIRDLVNNKLLPFMAMHGIAMEGYIFEWDEAVEYTPEEMRGIEAMLLQNGCDIPPQYFTDRYNIPIDGRTSPPPTMKAAAASHGGWWENPDFFCSGRSQD